MGYMGSLYSGASVDRVNVDWFELIDLLASFSNWGEISFPRFNQWSQFFLDRKKLNMQQWSLIPSRAVAQCLEKYHNRHSKKKKNEKKNNIDSRVNDSWLSQYTRDADWVLEWVCVSMYKNKYSQQFELFNDNCGGFLVYIFFLLIRHKRAQRRTHTTT